MDEPPRSTPWRSTSSASTHYHYNREEREASRQRIWTPPSGGFFRRNRALTLTLIDVIVVLVLFAIVMFVVGPMAARGTLGDYRLSVEAIHFDGEILVAVTVTDTEFGERSSPPTESVIMVRVGQESVSDLVPTLSQERTLRLRTSLESARSTLRGDTLPVHVSLGERIETLRATVSGEPVDR